MKGCKSSKIKIVCLLLVLVMAISVLVTSCDKKNDDKLNWNIDASRETLALTLVLEGDETNRTLVLSSESDVFAEDVNINQFKILYYDDATDKVDEKSNNLDNYLVNWSVNRDSAKRLTFTLLDSEDSAHWAYSVVVHPTATTVNKFGEAWAFQSTSEELD